VAQRTFSIISNTLLLFVVFGPLVVLLFYADQNLTFTKADWAALKFTLKQAALSSLLSVFMAWPLALALSRRHFIGRRLLILTLSVPFILPVIVAVLGLLSIFGNSGLLNSLLKFCGLPVFSIYGLTGVLLAHIFFNIPLATRAFLLAIDRRPAELERVADGLNLKFLMRFWILDWPILRLVGPQIFSLIFALCLTSFAVVLTLGGGPKATTLELAIYQAFRFELDFGRAAFLALIQLSIAALACCLSILIFGLPTNFNKGLDRPLYKRYLSIRSSIWDFSVIILIGLFLILPLISVISEGVQHFYLLENTIWTSILNSINLALCSALISTILALGFMSKWGEVVGTLSVAVSPLIIGAGLFLMVRNYTNPFEITFWVTLTVNSIMGLPFSIRIMRPASDEIVSNYKNLANAISMGPFAWFYWVYIPRLKEALTYSMGLVAALSMGDLGVIVLFGGADFETLPLVIYQLMGAYRTGQAMASAVILVSISIGIFLIFDKIGKVRNA